MECMRRDGSHTLDSELLAGRSTAFRPDKPWCYIFELANGPAMAKRWHDHVEEPCILIITNARSFAASLDVGAAIADRSAAYSKEK